MGANSEAGSVGGGGGVRAGLRSDEFGDFHLSPAFADCISDGNSMATTWNRTLAGATRARMLRMHRARYRLSASAAWSLLSFVVVSITFAFAPAENKYPGALVGAFVFFFTQWFLPACRPVSGKLLCPWNWALFVFFLQLVLVPLSILVSGPSLGVLPFLPSDHAINLAMIINAIAFIAFCASYQYFFRRSSTPASQRTSQRRQPMELSHIAIYGGIGLVGFFLAFGDLNKIAEYFSDPAGYLSHFADVQDRLGLAAGLFLRPFLGICVVMLWCYWLERGSARKTALLTSVATILAIVAVCFSNATFNYNRGSVIVPLIAMLAMILSNPNRAARRTIFSAGALVSLVLLVTPFYGAYRGSKFTGQEILKDPSVRSVLTDKVELTDMLQVYAGAPQFLGFFLEMDNWGATPQLGKVLASSALAPLPVLGKPFRENSGTAIYNRFIYGVQDVQDQIAPFQGEIFLDFHLPGLLVGFAFLGWLAFKLQTAFAQSSSFFDKFVWQYFSVWIFFLIFGSVSVVSQIFIYFCWPFYLYFTCKRLEFRVPGRSQSRLRNLVAKPS